MKLSDRIALLSTGAKVPLVGAAGILGLLDRLLDGTPEQRSLVIRLRQACLTDEPPAAADAAAFIDHGFAKDHGSIDPVAREVVLAAVHGTGTSIQVVSPFVNLWDQTLAELIVSHAKVRGALEQNEAEQVLAEADALAGGSAQGRSWLTDILMRRPPNGGVPPPGAN
jgi:hypothetical protein